MVLLLKWIVCIAIGISIFEANSFYSLLPWTTVRYIETKIAKNTEVLMARLDDGTLYSSIELERPKMPCLAYLRKMRVSVEYRAGWVCEQQTRPKKMQKKKNARAQNPKLLLHVGLLLIESHDKEERRST